MRKYKIKVLKDSEGLYISDYSISYVYNLNSIYDFKLKQLASALIYAAYHYNLQNMLKYATHNIIHISITISNQNIIIDYKHSDKSNNFYLLFMNEYYYLDEKNDLLYECDNRKEMNQLKRKLKLTDMFL